MTIPIAELAMNSAWSLARQMSDCDVQIAMHLVGRRAIVRSNYNGQPYGRSAKPWTGREVTISHAFYSGYGAKPAITIWLVEERVGGGSAALGLEELEVLD